MVEYLHYSGNKAEGRWQKVEGSKEVKIIAVTKFERSDNDYTQKGNCYTCISKIICQPYKTNIYERQKAEGRVLHNRE
ncbi:hypothetical protein CYANOKiyG1_00590 [Okeania sp. KiyG1]|nr:hypothetical protein CYANOKiyG1_00590 [Okeania sp. KiyG1]